MEEIFKDDVAPGRWIWCVINNLNEFNDKPEYMTAIFDRFHKIKEHHFLSTFEGIFLTIEKYYKENNSFPGIEWLKLNYQDVRTLVINDSPFSMQIYQSLIRYIDQEILLDKINKELLEVENPSVERFRDLAEEMQKFSGVNGDIFNFPTSADIINSYQDDTTSVIPTGIQSLDNTIRSLDSCSINVIACPSGHGKTVLALNIAYNNILKSKKVVYVSFELTYDKLYNCFAAIHGFSKEDKIKAHSINKGILTPEEKELRKEYLNEILKMPITVIDTNTMERINRFDDLLNALEVSEKTNTADLIIFDNVDGFVRFCKSTGNVMTEVNNMVSKLEKFAQNFAKKGTTVLLLSQTNRKGIKDLEKAVRNQSENIDYTCISSYSDVYQKARTVLVGYSDAQDKKAEIMHLYLVKSTFSAPSADEIKIGIDFDYVKTINNAVFSSNRTTNSSKLAEKDTETVDEITAEEIDKLLEDDDE